MPEVVLTGAGGFVGREACRALLRSGHTVRALVRRPFTLPEGSAAPFTLQPVGDLAELDQEQALRHLAGADALVHLAAHVHRLRENPAEAARAYLRDVSMTQTLALAAARVGLRRLVYLSSVKALGDRSYAGPLAPTADPQPVDAYGRAKLEAERQLARVSRERGLSVVVVRAPLVYGAAAGANFRALVQWVRRGVPLPLGGVHNRRSVLSVDNLADFIVRCLGPVDGKFCTYHVADADPVSTPQLLRLVAEGAGVPARLFQVPTGLLQTLCTLGGRRDMAVRLLLSLELETDSSFAALGWRPPVTSSIAVPRAVREMCAAQRAAT